MVPITRLLGMSMALSGCILVLGLRWPESPSAPHVAPAQAPSPPVGEDTAHVEPACAESLADLEEIFEAMCPLFTNHYSADPERRVRELLQQSEDLRQIEEEWERIYGDGGGASFDADEMPTRFLDEEIETSADVGVREQAKRNERLSLLDAVRLPRFDLDRLSEMPALRDVVQNLFAPITSWIVSPGYATDLEKRLQKLLEEADEMREIDLEWLRVYYGDEKTPSDSTTLLRDALERCKEARKNAETPREKVERLPVPRSE
jgi:hypothetical protein